MTLTSLMASIVFAAIVFAGYVAFVTIGMTPFQALAAMLLMLATGVFAAGRG